MIANVDMGGYDLCYITYLLQRFRNSLECVDYRGTLESWCQVDTCTIPSTRTRHQDGWYCAHHVAGMFDPIITSCGQLSISLLYELGW